LSAAIRDTAFAAIDFESARLADRSDAPIQVGIAWMSRGEIEPESFLRSWIRPPAPVVRLQADFTLPAGGLAEAPASAELWPALNSRLAGRTLVGHGSGTERRFLRMYPLHGFGPWVDSLLLARAIFPKLAGHSLGELIKWFSLEPELGRFCPGLAWHDALYDAVACLLLLRRLLDEARLWDQPADWLERPRLA